MKVHPGGDPLITSLEELLERIRARFGTCSTGEVYISGSNMSSFLGMIFTEARKDLMLEHFNIMMPSVSAVGMLFRARASRSGAEVRITGHAVHDIIVGNGSAILVSVFTTDHQRTSLLAVELTDDTLYKQVLNYMVELWATGLSLKL